jgi:plastocyanin
MLTRTSRPYIAAALGALTVPLPAGAATLGGAPHRQVHRARAADGAPLSLAAVPRTPVTGEPIRFTVLGAAPVGADYEWDLTGRGTYLFDTGATPRLSDRLTMPGSYRVTVRVTNGALTRRAVTTISVRLSGPSEGTVSGKPTTGERARGPKTTVGRQSVAIAGTATPVPRVRPIRDLKVSPGAIGKLPSTGRPRSSKTAVGARAGHALARARAGHVSRNLELVRTTHRPRRVGAVRHPPRIAVAALGAKKHATSVAVQSAHAASDPAVTIADFQFTPSSTTVHVGDTVTWTNNGPSSHTATARDGSFDSGILKKGQSASHAFTQPGTYAFYCKIHPFMHSTITVLAAATSTTPSTGSKANSTSSSGSSSPNGHSSSAAPSSSGTTPSAPTSTSTGDQSLPMTGFNVVSALGFGLVLVGSGLAIRRRLGR